MLYRAALLAVLLSNLVYGLSPFLDDWQWVEYRPVSATRRKRATEQNEPVQLRFHAYNRSFHLQLYPEDSDESSPFAVDHSLDVDNEYQMHDSVTKHLFHGHVIDVPGSRVYGSLLDGVFDGHIHLPDGNSFTVDKTSKYVAADDVHRRRQLPHSLIYHDRDVNHVKMRAKRSTEPGEGSCALDRHTMDEMIRVQRSAEPLTGEFFSNHMTAGATMHRRKRRVEKDANGLYNVRTCSLYLQADHKLYEHIRLREGNKDSIRTREEIVSLFYNHVKAVNEIYEGTDFGGIKGLHFVVQRTSIYTPDSCDRGRPVSGSDNPFCEENVDVSNFLNLNSKRDHSAFCLAYAFTFRDFVGGTLGLAWVALPQFNIAGGVCQLFQSYNEGSRGWVDRSLNTGIVTLVNYGNRVPMRVSQLTLAHEIGHNFGSPHDFPPECQPGLPDGNFIMFASATSGDKPNNAKFSHCSINNITALLRVVLASPPVDPTKSGGLISQPFKRNCFQERTSAFCGNQIHEPGEECDCGFSEHDCQQMGDKCCTPHQTSITHGPGPCRRKPGARCSPSEGYCCSGDTCSFVTDRRECRRENDCQFPQICDGQSAQCPASAPKPDGLACQDGTKVCSKGFCEGSVCELFGLKDCFLTVGRPEDLCYLACEKNGTCISSVFLSEFSANSAFHEQIGRKGKDGLVLHPGSPCNNYKGYCDIFRKCRSVDANGPLARLKNLLFNRRTIESVSQWVHDNRWLCLLAALAFLVFMALFVKCCAVHTPSTNPNRAPAQSPYDTLRRPRTLIERRQARNAVSDSNAQVSSTDRFRGRKDEEEEEGVFIPLTSMSGRPDQSCPP